MSEMVSEALHTVLSYFKSSGGIMATGNRWPEQRYTKWEMNPNQTGFPKPITKYGPLFVGSYSKFKAQN